MFKWWKRSPLAPADEEKEGFLTHKKTPPAKKSNKSRRVSTGAIIIVCMVIVILGIFSTFLFSIRDATLGPHPERVCSSPSIRREWRTLTSEEKQEYTTAIRCLATTPSRLSSDQSLHDDFSYIHIHAGGPTHDTPYFLPWHRYFVHIYEKRLREQCAYRGHMPYWDWTLDWQDLRRSAVWNADDGFGGDGHPSAPESIGRGRCVLDGPFGSVELKYLNRTTYSHCLSRGFPDDDGIAEWRNKIAPENIGRILMLKKYHEFFNELENGPHLAIPFSIRGDFFYFTAPNDPIFFLHHTQLDRLWYRWQNEVRGLEEQQWTGRATSPPAEGMDGILEMNGLAPNIQVRDVINIRGPLLCYTYV